MFRALAAATLGPGAIQLRDAIDKALLIGAPVQNPEGNAN